MINEFSRTELLLGADGMEKLKRARVAVFGIGGVGGYAVEALARAGIGALDLIDNDVISLTNINRQIIALHSTLGIRKTEAAERRARDINPAAELRSLPVFVTAQNVEELPLADCDYIVDAIDTVSAKIALVMRARALGIPIISSMGTGNKLDPGARPLPARRRAPEGIVFFRASPCGGGRGRDKRRSAPPRAGQHSLCPWHGWPHDRGRSDPRSVQIKKEPTPSVSVPFLRGLT